MRAAVDSFGQFGTRRERCVDCIHPISDACEMQNSTPPHSGRISVFEVLRAFTVLGFTSFGGPVAHLGYFRDAFVVRRRWLDDRTYADIVALCQFLPGPASSQVGLSIGLFAAGLRGALAAWLGFTLPSALALVAFGYGVTLFRGEIPAGLLHGLNVVAVAVVARAVWGMARNLTPDRPRITLAMVSGALVLFVPSPLMQIGVIIFGAAVGMLMLEAPVDTAPVSLDIRVHRFLPIAALVLFFGLLAGLPFARAAFPSQTLALVDSFYRSGSLVFGGGHVVLPLLHAQVVPTGWVSNGDFLAGYGAAQAVPGPLFTFAAFLGTVSTSGPNGWQGAAICLGAIYVPSFLLVIGVLPYWDRLRVSTRVRRALLGINAAVVGLLLAALYKPVWSSSIHAPADFALVLGAFTVLMFWRWPPWLVVISCALGGWVLSLV